MLHPELRQSILETLDNYQAGGVIPLAVTFNQFADEKVRQGWDELFKSQPGAQDMIADGYIGPDHDLAALSRLPEGTLGKVYATHMLENGLTPNLHLKSKYLELNEARGLPVEKWRVRLTQVHDLWHVLTGYDVSMLGELKVVSFTVAQAPNAYTALIMTMRSLQPALQHPEQIGAAFDAITEGWERGRKASSLLPVRWEEKWECSLDALRREYNLI